MIRISLFLVLFAASAALSAQDVQSVFIEKNLIKWYQSVIVEYDQAVKNLQEGDQKQKAQSRKAIRKILKNISNNCASMSATMLMFIDNENNESLQTVVTDGVEVNALQQRNNRIRSNKTLAELKMSMSDYESFKANLEQITQLYKELEKAGYVLDSTPSTRNRQKVDKLNSISFAANANNAILINKTLEL